MVGRKWQTVPAWRLSPRVELRPGDRFKASGGPYYRTATGRRVSMGERGVFVLLTVIVQRSAVFLQGAKPDGSVALVYVGPSRSSRVVPGLRRVPHRVRRVVQ